MSATNLIIVRKIEEEWYVVMMNEVRKLFEENVPNPLVHTDTSDVDIS
jgi:hypothetical protein